MPYRFFLLALALGATLAACQPAQNAANVEDESARETFAPEVASFGEEPAASDTGADAQCSADPVQALVGQHLSDELLTQALKDSGASIPRVLGPDTPATLDLSHARLNIIIDGNKVIQALHCG